MTKTPLVGILLLAATLAGCEVGTVPTDSALVSTDAASGPSGKNAAKPQRVAHGNLKFIEGYQKGYDRGLTEGKPMLVFFTAEWCHFCHQMANEAFTNDQVVSLSEQFTCILVDADAEPEVARQFHVQAYPTIQFLSPRGVPLNRIVGKKPGHQLMIAMQTALQNVARRAEADSETTTR